MSNPGVLGKQGVLRRRWANPQHDERTAHRRSGRAALLLLTVLALTACDQFGQGELERHCVEAAMKDEEPFGNDKDRVEYEAQFRLFCKRAVENR